MATITLPHEPNLEHLRNQARDLQRAVRSGDAESLALVEAIVPDLVAPGTHPGFALATAQLVVARTYGLASWTRLKEHVELVTELSRRPDEARAAGDPADELLRLACLTYGNDDPARWQAARGVLDEHPEAATATIHAAAATASVAAVEQFLAADPGAASAEGGPHRWTPLLYLAYARHDPGIGLDAVLATARLLVAAGADVDAGYLWHGLPSPFTVLTGAFGDGELGHSNQPPHPHGPALAALLLEAGADPNDRQALYNRQFGSADDHLVLLFAHGLGTDTADPWQRRLGGALQSPTDLVRDQLRWAVTHHQRARVALLADHGVDIRAPFADGPTPVELALLSADRAIVADLVDRGAVPPALDPPDTVIAAVLATDRSAVDAVVAEHPRALTLAQERRPALVVRAAVDGGIDAVRLAVDLGWSVDALGRTDTPIEQPWETALHHAAGNGDRDLAEALLALGADPAIRDGRFDATPLGWARHFDHADLVGLLEPVTPEPEPAPVDP